MSGYIFRNPVTISDEDMGIGAWTGVRQRNGALARGLKEANGAEERDGLDMQIRGAIGEIAYCRWAGCPWTPRFVADSSTDYDDVQIRTVGSLWWDLTIYPKDSPDQPFVLVASEGPRSPRFDIPGWILGRDAKIEAFRNRKFGNRPSFLVPRQRLLPMSFLKPYMESVKAGGLAHPNAGPPFSSVTS